MKTSRKTPRKAAAVQPAAALPPAFEMATLRRRLASMLYDGMLMVAVLIVTFLVPQTGYSMSVGHTAPGWAYFANIFLVLGGYFVWCWRRGGQTLAMKTWHLKLEDAIHGGQIPVGRAWLRYSLCWPSLLFFGVGLFWVYFDSDGQFLHDRLAGTRVAIT